MKEKRKHSEVPTSELLDFIGKDIPFDKEADMKKQRDYRVELEERRPFYDLKRKIDQMQEKLNKQQDIIIQLLKHQHNNDGLVMVEIVRTKESSDFTRGW